MKFYEVAVKSRYGIHANSVYLIPYATPICTCTWCVLRDMSIAGSSPLNAVEICQLNHVVV